MDGIGEAWAEAGKPEAGKKVKSKIEYLIYCELRAARDAGNLTFEYEQPLELPRRGHVGNDDDRRRIGPLRQLDDGVAKSVQIANADQPRPPRSDHGSCGGRKVA